MQNQNKSCLKSTSA